jgi:hypothetical protein
MRTQSKAVPDRWDPDPRWPVFIAILAVGGFPDILRQLGWFVIEQIRVLDRLLVAFCITDSPSPTRAGCAGKVARYHNCQSLARRFKEG